MSRQLVASIEVGSDQITVGDKRYTLPAPVGSIYPTGVTGFLAEHGVAVCGEWDNHGYSPTDPGVWYADVVRLVTPPTVVPAADARPGQQVAKHRGGTACLSNIGIVDRYPATVEWWTVVEVTPDAIVCAEGHAIVVHGRVVVREVSR